ncbi:MAG: CoA transferase [Chloroflexi bacterium]|nr:CoA transferase [Chloroflexota bacterium]
MAEQSESMLSGYRVLDLTDEKGLLCGKILGDLGADVIKVERPEGDAARHIGPFYHNEPHPERSLFWFAMNTSKRGITLNIETIDGREIFKKLVKKADFVIESFAPGYLNKLGLGYKALEKINPAVIMVSITPYGPTGPYKDWKTSDIVAWAMGGEMNLVGDADRPPIRMSGHSQVFLQSGSDGAMGALAALWGRWSTGQGQQVDVSVLDSAAYSSIYYNPGPWARRGGAGLFMKRGVARQGGHRTTNIYRCKDGWVCYSHGGSNRLSPSLPLIKWMEAEGFTNDFLKNFDWDRPDFATMPQEEMDQVEEPTSRFFMSKTKAELLEGCVKYQIMMYPCATAADMLENPQLAARGFWVRLEHPELHDTITYAGAFGSFSEAPIRITRRAPLIGEHNEEIYGDELGISKEKLLTLKQAGVI